MLRVKLVLVSKYIGRHHRKNSTTIRRGGPLQALIFDSHYNPFRGIEVIFRVKNGQIKGQKIKFMATGNEYFADEMVH
jgi:translation elongation factor EF-4